MPDNVWQTENENSLKGFENIFPIKSTNWEYGYQNFINYKLDTIDYDEVWEFTGIRLLKWLVNNYWNDLFKPKYIGNLESKKGFHPVYSKCTFDNSCVLTGYCLDNDILDPIYNFIKKPDESTLEDLLYDCLQSWVFACRNDYEYQQSDEYITEEILANEYEFTADGEMY